MLSFQIKYKYTTVVLIYKLHFTVEVDNCWHELSKHVEQTYHVLYRLFTLATVCIAFRAEVKLVVDALPLMN